MMAKNVFLKNASKRATLGLAGLSMAGMLLSCNAHPVSFSQSSGSVVITSDRSPDSAASVDILWMIDNSGSMCKIQESIRQNFLNFIDQITLQNIDFQMGVTTSDFARSSVSEVVSRPGYLQAVPQPVPTNFADAFGNCRGDAGDPSDPMDGFEPVRTNIEIAISCTKEPELWQDLVNVTDDEIAAAYERDENNRTNQHRLFPTTPDGSQPGYDTPAEQNPYRAIRGDNPLVLHSENYRDPNTGQLDVDAMRADFACMSLVGTTGTGFEKGLAGAIHAVSPEMTGGPVEQPLENGAQAPNHGLIRQNANFALVMVTDENDCTDYGAFGGDSALPNTSPFYDEQGNVISRSVHLSTPCVDSVCAMWNDPALAGITPLVDTEKLAERFKQNLAASKGKEQLNENSIVVTSIHGESRRYGEVYPTPSAIEAAINAEAPADQETISANIDRYLSDPNSCADMRGTVDNAPYSVLAEEISCTFEDPSSSGGPTQVRRAFSGDRYDSFLRHFSQDFVLPKIPTGLICDPASMGATLGEIGELIAGSVAQCVVEPPHECLVDEDCPAFAFGDDEPRCLPFGRSDRKFCDSGMQLRIYPGTGDAARTFADLQSNPYCIPESIDSEMTPGGCVMDRSRFTITECAAVEAGMNIEWVDEDSFQILGGYSVELVYSVIPEPEQDATP